jgi:hypothetical protein
VEVRRAFMTTVLGLVPELTNRHYDPRALFRDLLSRRSITPLLAKFAHDVLEIFYATNMLHMNPELRGGHLENNVE